MKEKNGGRDKKMIRLVKPEIEEMWFRQALLADEATMSYNQAYGGTIEFTEKKWDAWFQKWVTGQHPGYFYRYLYCEELGAFVGEAAYHLEEETGRYLCDVIVHSKHRGQGFGKQGLDLLCQAAKRNGIAVLYDDISIHNPSVKMFLKSGFVLDDKDDACYTVKKIL